MMRKAAAKRTHAVIDSALQLPAGRGMRSGDLLEGFHREFRALPAQEGAA
jgi:hypothetical protein